MTKKRNKRLSYVLGLLFLVAVVAALYFATLKGVSRNRQPTVPKPILRNSEKTALEAAFRLTFPEGCKIEKVALIHGKDSFLFMKIAILPDQVNTLENSFQDNFMPGKSFRIINGIKTVPWYKIAPNHLGEVLTSKDRTTLVFTDPINGKVYVYMTTGSTSGRGSKQVYDIFLSAPRKGPLLERL